LLAAVEYDRYTSRISGKKPYTKHIWMLLAFDISDFWFTYISYSKDLQRNRRSLLKRSTVVLETVTTVAFARFS